MDGKMTGLFVVLISLVYAQSTCESFSSAAGDIREDTRPVVLYFDICTSYCYEGNLFWNTIIEHGNNKGYPTSEWYHVQTSGSWGSRATEAIRRLAAGEFTNIMVYDLSSASDMSSSHVAMYNAIGNWFNAVKDRPLILDGRIISSLWTFRFSGAGNKEIMWNYLENLRVRGGGMYLGTDHANAGTTGSGCTGVFVSGINEINKNIKIGPFCDSYYVHRFAAVDSESPVMKGPEGPSGWCIESLPSDGLVAVRNGAYDSARTKAATCTPTKRVLYDHSSTSSCPTGYQAGAGRTLYPAAYHYVRNCVPSPTNDCIGATAVTSTFKGSIGFLVNIVSPDCGSVWSPGDTITFDIDIEKGTAPFRKQWVELVDGVEVERATTNSWSATFDTSGLYLFRIEVIGADGERAEGFVNFVVEADPPVCSDVAVTTTVGVPVTGTMSAVQGEGQPISFELKKFPRNALFSSVVTADPNNAQDFTYEPYPCAEGEDVFRFIAAAEGGQDTCTITATITPDPAPVGSESAYDVREGVGETVSGSITLTSNQVNPGTLSYTVTKDAKRGSVVWGTLEQTGASATVDFTYTTTSTASGMDTITYTVFDGCKESESATITINLNPNARPVPDNLELQTPVNTALSGTLTASDPEGDTPIVIDVVVLPGKGTLVMTGDDFVYTPDAGETGRDRFTFRATDSKGASARGVVTILIFNEPPVVDDLIVEGQLGEASIPGQVTGSDPDGDGSTPLVFNLLRTSSQGTVTFNDDGSFMFVAEDGFTGTTTFTFTATDGKATSKRGTVTIIVPEPEAIAIVPPPASEEVEKKNNSMTVGAAVLAAFAVVVLAFAAIFTKWNQNQYEELEDAFAAMKNSDGIADNKLYQGNERGGESALYQA